jgi:hypothetical protein
VTPRKRTVQAIARDRGGWTVLVVEGAGRWRREVWRRDALTLAALRTVLEFAAARRAGRIGDAVGGADA